MTETVDMVLYSTGYAKVVDMTSGGYAFLCQDIQYQPARLPYDPEHSQELEEGTSMLSRIAAFIPTEIAIDCKQKRTYQHGMITASK